MSKYLNSLKFLGKFIVIPVGLSEVILSFSPIEIPISFRPLLLLISLILCLTIFYFIKPRARLVADIPLGASYKIIFPCGDNEYRIANKLSKKAFGKENSISKEKISDWKSKNPFLLSILVDNKHKLRGYFDLIPLDESFYNSFKSGLKTEKDISSKVILANNVPPKYIYIGGITTIDGNPIVGSVLITALILKIKYLYYSDIIVAATAATDDGEHYLNCSEFCFELSTGKDFRTDGLNFYEKRITPAIIDGYIKELGRKSKFLDYSSYKKAK